MRISRSIPSNRLSVLSAGTLRHDQFSAMRFLTRILHKGRTRLALKRTPAFVEHPLWPAIVTRLREGCRTASGFHSRTFFSRAKG